jgi:nicotinate-nucleotide adenylyltransferase
MTELATAGEPGFAISLADAPRPDGRPNFTLETLEEVRAQLGSRCTLFCLMGADSYFGLTDWYRAPEIPFAATLIVASRPGEPLDAMQKAIPHGLTLTASADTNKSEGGVRFCEYAITNTAGEKALFYVLPDLDVPASATEIRRQIQQDSDGLQKSSPAALLPQAVAEYICTHHLYR